ncbi:MAG: Jag family protein [Thermodesulfobacteriota bacterium]
MALGLINRIGIPIEVEGYSKEGVIYLEIKTKKGEILIGKGGRILEALQFLINRMVNKKLKENVTVYIDINQYKAKKTDALSKMTIRLGEKVKKSGKAILIGPYNPHDRKIIHVTLKNDPSLRTESLGEGEMKKVRIIPSGKPL